MKWAGSGIVKDPPFVTVFRAVVYLARPLQDTRCCHSTSKLCRGYHPEAKRRSFKANRPSGKACSHVSIDQNCVTYPFFNLLLANRMKLWWTSGSSLLRWKLSPLLNTGPWLEEGNQHFLPKGIWWSGPWSDVRCDKQEGRLMGSGFGTCPSTYYLWDLKLLALFPRLEIRGMILGPFKD